MLHRIRFFGLIVLVCIPLGIYAQPALELDAPARKIQPAADQPAADQPAAETASVEPVPAETLADETEAPLDARDPAEINSLAQLDAENQRLGNWIRQGLSSLPDGARIQLGQFLLDNAETPLGVYWRNQLSSILSSMPARNFVILSNAAAPADYALTGEIIRIGNVLRIYNRLTKLQDSSLITTWNLDMVLTPFIQELLAGSGARPDKDNPLAVEIGAPWITRNIRSGDEDWFSVYAETSGILILETDGSIDTFMELYDGDSKSKLASDDDNGSNLNARIEYFVEAGRTYIIKVQGYTGSYRFGAVLNPMPEDIFEPNDTQEDAASIELGVPVEAGFNSSFDVDWYKLDVPEEGGFLTVYTTGRLDTRIYLHAEDGTILADDDDSGSGLNARVSILAEAGTIYIRVIEVDGNRGVYTLNTRLREPGVSDAYEPDNTPETAKAIEIGTGQDRTFTMAEDVDWVTFTVVESGYYEIRTTAADQKLDTFIELYDEKGEYIDDDDDSGDNFDAYLKIQLDPGIYYIVIRCLDDDPLANNAYTLKVSAFNEN